MGPDQETAGQGTFELGPGGQGTSVLTLGRRFFGDATLDAEELAAAESFDLPGADLSSEEITEQVLAAQADEFTCASCFLVRHRSQIARNGGGQLFCTDCEG
jgi:hypothetical protein